MVELTTAARPYARAAYASAREDDFDKWLSALKITAQIVKDELGKNLIGDVRYSTEQITEVLKSVLDDSGINPKIWNFICLLVANRRLILVNEIVRLFEQYMTADNQIVRAEVVSAFTLNEEQQESIKVALAKRTGRKAEISCSVDPTLLGGAVVRMDDLVIDTSIKDRIEKLSAALSA